MIHLLVLTYIAVLPVAILDHYLQQKNIDHENYRWCIIHTMVNFMVVCLTLRGTVTMLGSDQDIIAATSGSVFNIGSSIVVMASHVYHLFAFHVTDTSLLAHHYIMLAVLLIPYFNYHNQQFMAFSDYSLFFMCGLPGMIDYGCMSLCYAGYMERLSEKRINNFLNTYIRAPGILYGAFVTWRMLVNKELEIYYAVPVILSFVWNAQFFSNAVAVSYGYTLGKKIDQLNA